MEYLQLITAILGLFCLALLLLAVTKLSRIATCSRNSERILIRILEIINEASNAKKRVANRLSDRENF